MKKSLLIASIVLNTIVIHAQDQSIEEMVELSCNCIEKIKTTNRTSEEKNQDVKECIESKIRSNTLISKLQNAMKDAKENNKKQIDIEINPSSKEYGSSTYFKIETALMETCEAMQIIVKSNDYIFSHSITKNEKSYNHYLKGQELFQKGDYEGALKSYKKALDIDPIFAFAWDNLGLTYRKLEKYDLALEAYNKSLELIPNGFMPLQNIPVIYELQKNYDKAIEAYLYINTKYPENAEADYGIGRIYIFYKNELEKGLNYMCKAYNKYVETNSPYRVDAGKILSMVYNEMDKQNQLEVFKKILTDNNIRME